MAGAAPAVFCETEKILFVAENIFSFANMMLSVVGKTLCLSQNILAPMQAKLAVAQMIFCEKPRQMDVTRCPASRRFGLVPAC
jgi:hypothetical protein